MEMPDFCSACVHDSENEDSTNIRLSRAPHCIKRVEISPACNTLVGVVNAARGFGETLSRKMTLATDIVVILLLIFVACRPKTKLPTSISNLIQRPRLEFHRPPSEKICIGLLGERLKIDSFQNSYPGPDLFHS